MPLEFPCNGCGQTLRVADEHAGKLARCPSCGAVVAAPASSPAAPPPAFSAPTGVPPVAIPGGLRGMSEADAGPSPNPLTRYALTARRGSL
jgi:hypothetical protein